MEYKLFQKFKNELFEEAKRLVPILYEDEVLLNCRIGDDLFDQIDIRYKNFSIDIELILVQLCVMKHNGADYMKEKVDMNNAIEHLLNYMSYKSKSDKINVDEISEAIAKDIINNTEQYKDSTLYDVVPRLAKKYMKCHNDSVDYSMIVMLLEKKLNSFGKSLETTDLNSLIALESF